jgi:hypothetical protein
MNIVPIHLRKKPLKYWGMVLSQSGPLWLQSVGHHGLGGTCKTAGTKFYLGIRYSVCRNSKGGGLHINLIPFYLIMKMNCLLTPPLVPTVQPSFVAITYGLIVASLVVVAHHNGRRGIPPSDLHGKCKPSSFSQS